MKTFDPGKVKVYPGGNLPRWRQDEVTYFITFRLCDSLPVSIVRQWDQERRYWLSCTLTQEERFALMRDAGDLMTLDVAATVAQLNPENSRDYHKQFTRQWQQFLDAGHGECVLARPDVRALIESSFHHFDGKRYRMGGFVIMPNHVHVLVTPTEEFELSAILHSWKSYSAKQINLLLGTAGRLWMPESHNHIVRSEGQFAAYQNYIAENPEKAYLREGSYTLWMPPT